MSSKKSRVAPEVLGFVDRYGLSDVFDRDLEADRNRHPVMHPFGGLGQVEQVIRNKGADFRYAQINYMNWGNPEEELATRVFAIIEPGKRSELTYWTPAAGNKVIDIHGGLGQLVLIRYGENEIERSVLGTPNDRDIAKAGIVPEACFYGVVADRLSESPLVISAFYKQPYSLLPAIGIPFGPLDTQVEVGGSRVMVPEAFRREFD